MNVPYISVDLPDLKTNARVAKTLDYYIHKLLALPKVKTVTAAPP